MTITSLPNFVTYMHSPTRIACCAFVPRRVDFLQRQLVFLSLKWCLVASHHPCWVSISPTPITCVGNGYPSGDPHPPPGVTADWPGLAQGATTAWPSSGTKGGDNLAGVEHGKPRRCDWSGIMLPPLLHITFVRATDFSRSGPFCCPI
jgi:hypothetical protein